VSAEVSPYAKTGGLADVAGSLPKELSLLGHDVRILMPKYGFIEEAVKYVTDFPVLLGDRKETCIIKQGELDNGNDKSIPVYFIENHNYYNRPGIYCYHDDGERFILLCKTALEMLPNIGFKPDIIHCNDWHTGPVCLLLKEKYCKQDFYKDISTVYTVHNLEYQGNFGEDINRFLNLDTDFFTAEKAEFYGTFSFMKCGLVFADIINTVSKKYAEEILTPAYGEKLEGVLNNRKDDLFGIVNGISYEEFNPGTNKALYANFDLGSIELKQLNKKALREEFSLNDSEGPLMGVICRLSGQKGLELLLGAIDEFILNYDAQLIVLGLGDEFYHNAFKNLQKKYPGNVAARFVFDRDLAQRIYAGCDLFLMPSRFEPCGLGQLISLRYGTIPVVRSVGGLAETITDIDEDKTNGNGFCFNEFTVKAFKNAAERAIIKYAAKTDEWKGLVIKALESDYSWKKPCQKYLELYDLALKRKNEQKAKGN
jgi:starch synthase